MMISSMYLQLHHQIWLQLPSLYYKVLLESLLTKFCCHVSWWSLIDYTNCWSICQFETFLNECNVKNTTIVSYWFLFTGKVFVPSNELQTYLINKLTLVLYKCVDTKATMSFSLSITAIWTFAMDVYQK